jgi:hypothetical protein
MKGVDTASVRQTDRAVERREKGDVPGPSPLSERNKKHPPLNAAGPSAVSTRASSRTEQTAAQHRTEQTTAQYRTEQKKKKQSLPSRVPDLVDDGQKRTLVKRVGKPERKGMARHNQIMKELNKIKKQSGCPTKCAPEYQAEETRKMKERDALRAQEEAVNPRPKPVSNFEYTRATTGSPVKDNDRNPLLPRAKIFDWKPQQRVQPSRKVKQGVKKYHMIWVSSQAIRPGKWMAVQQLPTVPEVPLWWLGPYTYWRWREGIAQETRTPVQFHTT